MATILSIKQDINDLIRTKTGAGSIVKTDHANIEDALANEIRDRGVLHLANTGALATASHSNTLSVVIKGAGIFIAVESGDSPDNITTFGSADSGWIWEKVTGLSGSFSIKVDGETGSPVAGQASYQDDRLIGADVQWILYNKVPLTLIDEDFTFNDETGTITLTNDFLANDTAVINY